MESASLLKKELLFSGAMGCANYQMGFAQSLLEIVGKERLKEYHLGGVSAGAPVTACLHAAINSEYDIKYWYENGTRKFYEPGNKGYYGLFTNGSLMKKICKNYWKFCREKGIRSLNEGKYHLYISVFKNFSFEKKIIDQFEDEDDFAEAVHASCYLPAITGFGLYTRYKGQLAFDGGVSMPIPYKFEDSEKIFVNVLPMKFYSWPIVKEMPKNIVFMNIQEEYNLKFPIDYFPWKEEWSDEMFLKGYLSGIKNEGLIKKNFKLL